MTKIRCPHCGKIIDMDRVLPIPEDETEGKKYGGAKKVVKAPKAKKATKKPKAKKTTAKKPVVTKPKAKKPVKKTKKPKKA